MTIREKADRKIQTMRDAGMTAHDIHVATYKSLIDSKIRQENEYDFLPKTYTRSFNKKHVSRKWLRGQLMSLGYSARNVDARLDVANLIYHDYKSYWEDAKVEVLGKRISVKNHEFLQWLFGDQTTIDKVINNYQVETEEE